MLYAYTLRSSAFFGYASTRSIFAWKLSAPSAYSLHIAILCTMLLKHEQTPGTDPFSLGNQSLRMPHSMDRCIVQYLLT